MNLPILTLIFIHFFTALNCGFFLFRKSKRLELFFLGISLTPLILSAISLTQSTASIPNFFWIIILLVTFCLLVIQLRRYPNERKGLRRNLALQLTGNKTLTFFSTFSLIGIILILLAYAKLPLAHHDSLAYASDAQVIAQNVIYPSFSDNPHSYQANHPHSPLFAHYLSTGLRIFDLFQSTSDLGLRINLYLVFLYLILSVTGFLIIHELPLLFGPLLFAINFSFFGNTFFLSHSLRAQSRDPFRLLTLFLAVFIFSTLIDKRHDKRLVKSTLTLLFLAPILALSGHTLNAIFFPLSAIAFIICIGLKGKKPIPLKSYTLIMLTGSVLGGLHYIVNYINHRNFFGFGFTYLSYKGTKLWTTLVENTLLKYANVTLAKKLNYLFFSNLGYANFIIILALSIPFFWRMFQKDLRLKFISITLLFWLIPYFGVLDIASVDLSTMFLKNFRYRYHWHFLFFLFSFITLGKLTRSHRFYPSLIVGIASFLSLAIFMNYNKKYTLPITTPTYQDQLQSTYTGQCKNTLIDDLGWGYYNPKAKTFFIYSKPGKNILMEKSDEVILKKLANYDIDCAILSSRKNWWSNHPLYDVLLNKSNTVTELNRKFTLFQL